MRHFRGEEIEQICSYEHFIPYLQEYYKKQVTTPSRPHYDVPTSGENSSKGNATLLLMPAWEIGGYTGIKIASVYPDNPKNHLPSVQAIYVLMDAKDGRVLATMDGTTLTLIRTAAISALASKLISSPEAESMIMIGTGLLGQE